MEDKHNEIYWDIEWVNEIYNKEIYFVDVYTYMHWNYMNREMMLWDDEKNNYYNVNIKPYFIFVWYFNFENICKY